jgi:hypothetical protein
MEVFPDAVSSFLEDSDYIGADNPIWTRPFVMTTQATLASEKKKKKKKKKSGFEIKCVGGF